jgi:LPPG:FO 2-phospho-L-lactate transferase
MEAVRSLGGPGWFNLGDGDLALHVMRLAGVAEGLSKSELTARFAKSWGVGGAMLPMSDDPVATMLETDAGILDFQSYFVRERCAPKVSCIWFAGADSAAPAPHVIQAIQTADLILIAPSNPWLSIDPILAVPGIGQALRDAPAPVVAISPLIGGKAVKGPTAKIMAELGLALANDSIAEHYGDVLDGLLIDSADSPLSGDLPWAQTQTLMTNDIDRERVAHAALEFGRKLRK